jgi:endonuclease/exonuclease/phosphatase family metal-dependent hydrolase
MYKIVRLFRILFENLFINYKKYDKTFHLDTNDTILSCNIRADHPRDNKTNWVYRRDAIIDMIKDKKPAIICMQEVQAHMFKWLYKRIHNQYDCVEYNSTKKHDSLVKPFAFLFGNGMVVWYDKNKIKLDYDKCLHADIPNLEKFLQMCFFTKDDKKMLVINTHYSLKDNERKKHTDLLNKEISEVDCDVYVCGDFNDTFNSKTVRDINLPYRIPFNDETQRTFNHFDDTWAIIDFIFSNKEINTYEIITKDYGVEYISDHYPIETPLK